ncbi:MAG: hypothetical protein QME49_03075 [bacterium]|nr:hypothetical protein [bacterium]
MKDVTISPEHQAPEHQLTGVLVPDAYAGRSCKNTIWHFTFPEKYPLTSIKS